MNGVLIEFFVGLYLLATAFGEPLRRPSIAPVRFIVGLILVLLAVFAVDLLALA